MQPRKSLVWLLVTTVCAWKTLSCALVTLSSRALLVAATGSSILSSPSIALPYIVQTILWAGCPITMGTHAMREVTTRNDAERPKLTDSASHGARLEPDGVC